MNGEMPTVQGQVIGATPVFPTAQPGPNAMPQYAAPGPAIQVGVAPHPMFQPGGLPQVQLDPNVLVAVLVALSIHQALQQNPQMQLAGFAQPTMPAQYLAGPPAMQQQVSYGIVPRFGGAVNAAVDTVGGVFQALTTGAKNITDCVLGGPVYGR